MLLGLGSAYIFFPDTCEIAMYTVNAGEGKAIAEWREPTYEERNGISRYAPKKEVAEDETLLTQVPENGVAASLGGSLEMAFYIGNSNQGDANAEHFQGVFHTVEVPTPYTVGIFGAGLSLYEGEKDETGGKWVGGTGGLGLGAALGKVNWDYKLASRPYELPTCACELGGGPQNLDSMLSSESA